MSLLDQIQSTPSGAIFGQGGTNSPYRYVLWREVNQQAKGMVAFIGLNPSTATAEIDDPTIRRCIRFTKDWGYRHLVMLNVFAFRATDPSDMKRAFDPFGAENMAWIVETSRDADIVVAAWGTHGSFKGGDQYILSDLRGLKCLGKTKHGHPKHPLYIRADTQLIDYP